MDPTKHFVEDASCDVYNRGSYGRGCELDEVRPQAGWPPPGTGLQGLTPTVLTTYRPDYGVPPPLSSAFSPYGPKYGPTASPPLQFFPVTPSSSPPKYFPTATPSPPPPPQFYPVGPPPSPSPPPVQFPGGVPFDTSTRPTGTYVPSQPPTTFFQIPGEYTPVSARPVDRAPVPPPAGGTGFKDSFDPYGIQNPGQGPLVYGPPKKRETYTFCSYTSG